MYTHCTDCYIPLTCEEAPKGLCLVCQLWLEDNTDEPPAGRCHDCADDARRCADCERSYGPER